MLVVLLHLTERRVQLIQLILCLVHLPKLAVDLALYAVVAVIRDTSCKSTVAGQCETLSNNVQCSRASSCKVYVVSQVLLCGITIRVRDSKFRHSLLVLLGDTLQLLVFLVLVLLYVGVFVLDFLLRELQFRELLLRMIQRDTYVLAVSD